MDDDKPTCFVMQTFDGGKYDRRYSESIRPALERAGVLAQRADEILGLNPVIQKIELAIQSATICLAEVSEDNPNVWLELGYALALDRPTIILCDRSARTKLPFDVQHRPVIFYRTDSRTGYDEMESRLVEHVTHALENESRTDSLPRVRADPNHPTDLETFEVSVLAEIFAAWPTSIGSVSNWDLQKAMKKEGLTSVGVALAVANLVSREFVLDREKWEEEPGGESYPVKHFQITPKGVGWLQTNRNVLVVDDDIPF